MSIDLPHNQRALHFTGSVKALAPERPANALGQERPKGPLPSPGRSIGAALAPPPRSARTHDVYLSEAQPTPYAVVEFSTKSLAPAAIMPASSG